MIGSKGRMMTKFSTRDIVVLNGNVIDSHYPHIVEKFTVKQLKGDFGSRRLVHERQEEEHHRGPSLSVAEGVSDGRIP